MSNLFSGITEQAVSIFLKTLMLLVADYVQRNFSPFTIPTTWWSILLLFVLFEFLFYWAHRLGHEVNVFWAAHVVHHQSESYNLSVALRQPWVMSLMTFFLFLPIPLLGFNALTFGLVAAVSTLYQFWIHTQTVGKLGWFEKWLNTPSHHRVHHGSNPQYMDKNYGGSLIIFDRLFGTFEEEKETVKYGVTHPFGSHNAVWANTYYWLEMNWAMQQLPTWKEKGRYLLARPLRLGNNTRN